MAIFHLHSQHIGRSAGRSAVAAAAYRSASVLVEELVDKSTGIVFEQVHDYRNKEGVFFSEVLTPERCALWMKDREMLWNSVQNKFDTRKNAVFAQEIDLALPVELSENQNLELLREFVLDTFVKEGVIVDLNIHYDNPENPHAHLMLSTRAIVWCEEEKDFTFGNKVRFWDTKEFLVNVRRVWARYINEHLEKNGFDMVVSHLSYKDQGIDLLPGIKEGIGRKIEGSDRMALNSEIRSANTERIFENPELVIDRIRRDQPVFTKETIAKELFKVYQEARESELVLDSDGTSHSQEKSGLELEYNDTEISRYTCDLAKVMSSDRLVCLDAQDLEGRTLYTSRVRWELEQDLLAKVDSIKGSGVLILGEGNQEEGVSVGEHYLDVSLDDLDRKNVVERIKDKVTPPLEKIGLIRRSAVTLSDKQKEVVLGVLNGVGVSVVEGLPGAGKTTVMREVARQYKKAGYDVMGAAVSASAASELGLVAGIASMSITKLRYEIERACSRKHEDFVPSLSMNYWQKDDEIYKRGNNDTRSLLTSKTVLIVDEASMVDLTEMHFIVSEVERAGAKLVLLGDRGQLSSVGIGGTFELMAEHFPPLRLDEVRRQRLESHREATKLLSQYKVADAIAIYRNTDVFKFRGSTEEARDELVRDFAAEYKRIDEAQERHNEHTNMVALSYTNEEVKLLNWGIREKLKENGVVYGPEVEFQSRKFGRIGFAAGDKVVFAENDKWLGVFNGDTGKVIGFGKSKDRTRDVIRVRLDNPDSVLGIDVPHIIEVDNHYYKAMEHGFAVNIYKSQGRTYNKVYALMDDHIGFHSFNVLATRHKDDLKIYVGEEVLNSELYKKISLDGEGAKETWNIKSDKNDPQSRLYAGLVAICQRRDDRTLSEDWRRFAERNEFRVLNDYVEARVEVIKLSKKIDEWVSAQNLRGASVKASEHDMYGVLQEELARRKGLAEEICDNYSNFGKLIVASNLNYNTVEKHAGRGEYKYSFERRETSTRAGALQEVEGFAELIKLTHELKACDMGPLFEANNFGKDKALEIAKNVSKITGVLIEQFDERRADIAFAKIKVAAAKHEKKEMQNFVRDASEYIGSNIRSFLERTYKEDPEVILERWGRVRDEHIEKGATLEVAITELKKNPQVLGSLKGAGIGSMLAFSKTRFRATVNMYAVAERIEKFEDYKGKLQGAEEDLKAGKYDEKIFEALSQVEILERTAASKEVEEFVREIHNVMQKPLLSVYQEREIQRTLAWVKNSVTGAKIDSYHEIIKDQTGVQTEKYEKLQKATGNMKEAKSHSGYSFDEVARNLTAVHFEEIFRAYANIINPDGRITKLGMRISAGSLGMDLKTGLWHRFSTGEGGNILGFVREARSCDIVDALEVVAGFARLQPKNYDISLNTSTVSKMDIEKPNGPVNEWVPYQVVPKDVPTFNPTVHLKHMMIKNEVGGVYTYKNESEEVIGHTIRLIAKENGSKQVLPVSYCQNAVLGQSAWRLKGFETYDVGHHYKPIYGMEKLGASENNNKPVIIVEGEKTADHAQELFPEYIVISWLGGASSADKVNWSVLEGRDTVIWPDNDEVGKTAARVIADRINGKAGAIGKCAIIDPSYLKMDDKVLESALPPKWDLGDELPQGITVTDLSSVLTNALDAVKNFDQAKILSIEGNKDGLDRVIWQNKACGVQYSSRKARAIVSQEQAWYKVLGSKEALAYIDYAQARGISESSHEFLKLDDKLYRESLVQIGILDRKLDFSHEAHMLDANIPELLRDVQEKYEQRRDTFTEHMDCSKDYTDILKRSSSDKSELMQILSRDVLLLHKLQLESGQFMNSREENKVGDKKAVRYCAVLCDAHKEKVVEDIYHVIKNYNVSYKYRGQDTNKLADADRTTIAEIVYEKLNSSDWWNELAEIRLAMSLKSKNLDLGVEDTKDTYIKETLKAIQRFDSNYDITKLKDSLEGVKCSLKHELLETELVRAFKAHISPYMDSFAAGKAKAKNTHELIHIMDKERKYCLETYSKHKDIALKSDDNYIAVTALYYNERPEVFASLKQDAENMDKFDIHLSEKEFERLKNPISHEVVANILFKHVQEHTITRISKNIDHIWDEKHVRVDGKKFTNVFAYTKYEIEEKNLARYLKGTEIHKDYLGIKEYCKENHISEMQYIRSRSLSRGIEK